MSNTTGPVLKYPGSKWNLAEWIVNHMPSHKTYLEPFFGSGAVFFNKTPSKGDQLEDARRFLVRCWQAFGTKTDTRTGWRNDIGARKYINMPDQWRKLPERILEAVDRLRDAQIENQEALKIIKRYQYDYVLIYADPPYPLETRHGKMYANEMTDEDHVELLEVLNEHPGPVLLSGYNNELYNNKLKNWTKKTHTSQAEVYINGIRFFCLVEREQVEAEVETA